jgi:DNA-binding NarL/FixJ family response regulator
MKSALILEDNSDVRAWLAELVRLAFPGIMVNEACTVTQATGMIGQTFDLALIDIHLPDGNGLTVLGELQAMSPSSYCVIATIFDDDENIFRALQLGAQGYLLKQDAHDKLLAGLLGILAGEPPLSSYVARRILMHFRQQPEKPPEINAALSDRELEILTMIAKGLSRPETARLLAISTATVATHIGAVYRKLNISNRSEATTEAIRMGLIKP